MQKLFVSFTSLLRLVSQGEVNDQDLDTGLFFFGCWREHALNPGAAGEADERTWHGGRYADAHPRIVQALLKAESEGRAQWHNAAQRTEGGWTLLDRLLVDNGYSSLQAELPSSHYSYPGVLDAVKTRGLNLQVIY